LGQLDHALRSLELQLTLTPADLWIDGNGRPWLFGLLGLRQGLGQAGVTYPAETLRALGGGKAETLEACLPGWRTKACPETLASWRLVAREDSFQELYGDPSPTWSGVRSRAVLRCFPEEQGGLVVLAGEAPLAESSEPRLAHWAVAPQHDLLRILTQARHDDATPEGVRARRSAFRSAEPSARDFPTLSPKLTHALAPALRTGEPSTLAPPLALPCPATPAEVVDPPRLRVSTAEEGEGALISLEDLPEGTDEVVVVRCGAVDPLVPADGEVLAELPVAELPWVDPQPGERYAAFPRCAGRLTPPAFAAYWGGPEVAQLEVSPGIGAIELRWEAPDQALIEILADGKLAHSAQGPGSWVHDCLDPGQRIAYCARVSLSDGNASPGLEAAAVALGPPPALGDVAAVGGEGQVTLSWDWPDAEGYELVRVEREPAFSEGTRVVRRGAEAELVDLDVDPGVAYAYQLRTAWGEVASIHESTAEATPWAELSNLRATPGGESVWLSWTLPSGVDVEGTEVVLVRNREHPPADLDDGDRLKVSGLDHLDRPLPVGEPVHYRVALRCGPVTSTGALVQATPRASAGSLGPVAVEAGRGALSLRFTPPAERCDAVQLFAGPVGGPLQPIETPPAPAGGAEVALDVPATPGVLTRLRLVPSFEGHPDPGQAVDVQGSAWDDLSDLEAPARADGIELRWKPPSSVPAGYLVRRIQAGRDGDQSEWTLPGDASSFLDETVKPRLSYRYFVACQWSSGAAGHEPHELEVTALAEPPDLPKAELRVRPGNVSLRYLPVASSARLRFTGAAVYSSAQDPDSLRTALSETSTFDRAKAAELGLTELAYRKRSKRKEVIRCEPPPPGTLATLVLASLNQGLAKPVLIEPALGLGPEFGALTAESTPAGVRLRWTWPEWLAGGTSRLLKLALERGLDDVPESLSGEDLETLSAPWSTELPLTATEFEDQDALGFLAWGYRLAVTLSHAGQEFTVDGPRLVVPPTPGGTLRLAATQPRGLFGAKSQIELRVECPAPRWPEFEIVRVVGNQQAGKVVVDFGGGTPTPLFVDEDLSNFSTGTKLRYRVELKHPRDKIGFDEGSAELHLG